MSVLGLDIGGANLKAADIDGNAWTVSFPLWRGPEQLESRLREIISRFADAKRIAVTMTAELTDCFADKVEGVDRILTAVEQASDGRPIVVWQTGAEFLTPDQARELPYLTAAANWHALATWAAGTLLPDSTGLLMDIGSTTTDLAPLRKGLPDSVGFTDRERLISGELVYSGAKRTPLCAIARSVPIGDSYCPLAAEFFATTLDVYLLLEDLPEAADQSETADGRAATRDAAHSRLAHMLCCDRHELSRDEAIQVARFLADVQRQRITGAVERVLRQMIEPPAAVLISGSGSFLAERIAADHPQLRHLPVTRLADCLGSLPSTAACALAVARLAADRIP